MMNGRAAAATERTPLTLGTAAAIDDKRRDDEENDAVSANASAAHQHQHHHRPIMVLLGSIVGLAGICLLMLSLIGGASYEVYQIVKSSNPSSQQQHIIVVEAEAAVEASSSSTGAVPPTYRTGCRYYKTTNTKQSSSSSPPRILQTSMSQAGSPWSWLDCEDATATSQTVELNAARAPDAVMKVDFGNGKTAANTSPTIMGFGGAFTEAAALNYQRLSSTGQTTVLDLLFGKNGLGYSIGRIPIHSCDFAVQSYDFDSVIDDIELRYFDDQVAHDVNNGMIPFIQAAQATYQAAWGNSSSTSFTLFGSPWSPPAWMKRPTKDNDPRE
jgi:hypothetical protein